MQILAVAGIAAAFALICLAIYLFGRYLQRRGHDLTYVDPRYPDSMQAVDPKMDVPPPGRPYTSLTHEDDQNPPTQPR
ncbi:hypothetical protein MAAFP003_2492 [Mycobacterium ahvazicum]|uniref:Uncharacterized protein n=1 Tax=Mycobacterium ahvazicum TaxID=1964395 RepID=A0A2K4YAJ6_9MYCO|nr:hypothetical protein [Mycobacterium ahvazicum]SOX53816.1 hypothetical protein MAAFP003_2492 [Mycobacterium ahvazicum]